MTFRNFIQRYWFAKTELNHLAGLGCNFKDHFGHFSDKPIKMSPFDQWFIWTVSHIWQIWYFKFETDRKKKKKHTKRRSCLNCQVSVNDCILWHREDPPHWPASLSTKAGRPQKLIPWEAENTARPTQPIWKPHRCVISIFFARLKSHNKKGPMDFGQIFARTELFAKVRRIDDFSSSGKKRITYL